MDSVLTILLAGGKGTRLDPLTRDRAKPAVPFGGMYRIVDFALSNCLNSRLFNILVLTQYKSLSLERHIAQGWGRFFHPEFGQLAGRRVPPAAGERRLVPGDGRRRVPEPLLGREVRGRARARPGRRPRVQDGLPADAGLPPRATAAPATVATLRCPVAEAAGQFGVVEVDADARVTGFQEKPEQPGPGPRGRRRTVWRRWGSTCSPPGSWSTSCGGTPARSTPGTTSATTSCPRIIGREPICAFTYSGGGTGGDAGTGGTWGRWTRTTGRTWTCWPTPRGWTCTTGRGRSTASSRASRRRGWRSSRSRPAGRPGGPRHNIFANGTVSEGWVRGSVVGFDCRVEAGAVVEDSILFDGVSVGRGAEVRRAILDKGGPGPPGARVGFDPDEDRRRGFVVSEGGVTCVPKDCRRYQGLVSHHFSTLSGNAPTRRHFRTGSFAAVPDDPSHLLPTAPSRPAATIGVVSNTSFPTVRSNTERASVEPEGSAVVADTAPSSVRCKNPVAQNPDSEGMGGSMTNQEGIADSRQRMFSPTGDVVELMLLLTADQFSALEVVAGRLDLTVGQLLRRTVSDFLLRPTPGNTRGTSGVGEST